MECMEKAEEHMSKKLGLAKMALLMATAAASPVLIAAGPAPAGDMVTITVTAVAKKGSVPRIAQNEVMLYQGKERLQVLDWRRSERLDLAVLIDDAVDSSAASQLNDLKEFINAQPETTYVAVAYARNGMAQILQDFTKDHAKAAKALRIPIGRGAANSPYLALQDLLKRLPKTQDRRAVVFVTSGIDYFRGSFTPFSPDLESTIERAQRENVAIYPVYTPGVGRGGRLFFRANNAQASLSKLAQETGGEAFYLGLSAPVSFQPYLGAIRSHLNNQYLLTFYPSRGNTTHYQTVRVETEVPNVKILAPAQVYVPKKG